MSRDAILSRIRAALGPPQGRASERAQAVAARLATPPRHPLPAFAQVDGEARATRLVRCLEGQGAEVMEIGELAALPDAIAQIWKAGGAPTHLVTGTDARIAALAWPPGTAPERWTPDQPLGDGYAALTHALAGVAETGTLVFASHGENPAALAFLPEVHLVALARDSIVGSFEEALAHVATRAPGRLPRAVNLVSSPSRTSDIGGRSVRGAHGPRRLVVFLYGPPN